MRVNKNIKSFAGADFREISAIFAPMGRFLEIVLEILFIYFLYRLVFDFIIPIYRSSRKVHDHIKEMQDRMQENLRKQQNNPPPPAQNNIREGEYIDYEEVKDTH